MTILSMALNVQCTIEPAMACLDLNIDWSCILIEYLCLYWNQGHYTTIRRWTIGRYLHLQQISDIRMFGQPRRLGVEVKSAEGGGRGVSSKIIPIRGNRIFCERV